MLEECLIEKHHSPQFTSEISVTFELQSNLYQLSHPPFYLNTISQCLISTNSFFNISFLLLVYTYSSLNFKKQKEINRKTQKHSLNEVKRINQITPSRQTCFSPLLRLYNPHTHPQESCQETSSPCLYFFLFF